MPPPARARAKKPSPEAGKDSHSHPAALHSQTYGVWDFWTVRQGGRLDLPFKWRDVVVAYGLVRRIFNDIFVVSPGTALLYVFSQCYRGIETALLMHQSAKLLQTIEAGVRGDHVDKRAVCVTLGFRLASLMFFTWLRWWNNTSLRQLHVRVSRQADMRLMRARLQMDLPSSQEKINHIEPNDPWNVFERVVEFFTDILEFGSQLTMLVHLSRESGSVLLTLLCLVKPAIRTFTASDLYSQMFLVYSNNPHFKRMKALKVLTKERYKQDQLTGNWGDHIIEEYIKSEALLGDTCTDTIIDQYHRRHTPYFEMAMSIIDDLPMMYCATQAVWNPEAMSLSSFAILMQSTKSLQGTFHWILSRPQSVQRIFSQLKSLYEFVDGVNKPQDGDLSYPLPDGRSCDAGMGFELENVSLVYPGSEDGASALSNVSLSIEPGQLVVIVGENGSGKSTMVKLLTRLYEPTLGRLLIDDTPAPEFRLNELREAMAMFTQDHLLFPLSLHENVAFGDLTRIDDQERVAKAAELGGATEILKKVGKDSLLDPNHEMWMLNVPKDENHPLQKRKARLSKKRELSGGEKQRVVAARIFMRLLSGKVKFVAVDEPTSAMDAEGESRLFQELIQTRAGKTMVIVTHRFGHLTKVADLIICMKKGSVAEIGLHNELMRLNGEYAKLFNIQAQSFSLESEADGQWAEEW